MGQSKRNMQVEANEENAVELIRALRICLAVPEKVPLLSFVKSQCTILDELAVAANMLSLEDENKWPGFLNVGIYVNPKAPRYVLEMAKTKIDKAIQDALWMQDVKEAQAKRGKVVIPPGNGKIVLPGER